MSLSAKVESDHYIRMNKKLTIERRNIYVKSMGHQKCFKMLSSNSCSNCILMNNISSVRKMIEHFKKGAIFSFSKRSQKVKMLLTLILKTMVTNFVNVNWHSRLKRNKNKKYTIRRLHENFDTCEEVYDDDVSDETNKQAGRLEGGSSCSRLT